MSGTESADPRFTEIDRWPTTRAVAAMIEGQRAAVAALDALAPAIAAAAEDAAARLGAAGRIAYAGAGTSARVAVQDGVELTPTYGWPEERLVYLIAGGLPALTRGIEGAEDDAAAARQAVAEAAIGHGDMLIGVAASGRTPYTIAAVEAARGAGALTVAIASNADTPLLAAADHALYVDTGSEMIAGSTRMQAGTAHKAVLNILSTTIMLRLGRVHRGRMVAMRISNAKLLARAEAMVAELAPVDLATARAALEVAGHDVGVAILIARGAAPDDARRRLAAAGGNLNTALTIE